MENVVGFHHKMKKLFITLGVTLSVFSLASTIQIDREPDIFKKKCCTFFFLSTIVLSSVEAKYTLKGSILPEHG